MANPSKDKGKKPQPEPKFKPTEQAVGMKKPVLETNMARMVAVTHVPEVGPEKYDKLTAVMKKVVARAGALAEHPLAFHMPKDSESGKSLGVVFVEYADEKGAKEALGGKVNGLKLDSAHVLEVYTMAQFDQTRALAAEFVPPAAATVPFVANERGLEWLSDSEVMRGWEMYLTQVGNETVIAKFNPKYPKEPRVLVQRGDLSIPGCKWSPSGTYFVSMHKQGAMVWPVTGSELASEPKTKLVMRDVVHVDFSPRERYVITRAPAVPGGDNVALLWDIAKGSLVVRLKVSAAAAGAAEPPFLWDADERFCVRRAPANAATGPARNTIEVFDLAKMSMRPLDVRGVTTYELSPRDPLVACFAPEEKGTGRGACISLVDATSGAVVRSHIVYKALRCTFHWHPAGRYLAAQLDSRGKGQTTVSSLVLFRMLERNCPTEVVEEPAHRIAELRWEPGCGSRFAYVRTDAQPDVVPVGRKGRVVVYDMGGRGSKARRVADIDHGASLLSWSPQQGMLLLCDYTAASCTTEFYNTNTQESLATAQHYNATSIQWDPSGRYVALVSSTTPEKKSADAGYDLYSFTGKILDRATKIGFAQFLWRPRPPCALDDDRLANLRKNLDHYRKQFVLAEKAEHDALARESKEKLRNKYRAFNTIMDTLLAAYDAEQPRRRELTHGYDPADPERFIVEHVEHAEHADKPKPKGK